MLQSNSFVENESQTEGENDDLITSQAGQEELPELIIERPPSKLCTFEGGLLIVWGCGEFGQHGHGHCEDVPIGDALGSPLWLGQDRMVAEVACGSSHTMVLTDDNKIYSWGNSNSGQLGVGTIETSPHPRPLHLGVSSGTKLAGITCGTRHSFLWTQDGDCFSFGNNYSGQLGYDFRKPDFKENQLLPIFVDTLLRRSVSQVACGARHSVFLFTNGQVAAVGVNNRGQIGGGDTVDVICPKTVPDLPAISVVACGNSHSIAADVHGSVHVWGYSKACGFKTDVLSPVCLFSSNEPNTIVDLAGGDSHSMMRTTSGIVYSWGNNFEGQLGHGKSVKFLSKPTELSSSLLPGKVVSMSVGENTSAAVTDDGKLYLWGKNASQVIRDDESSRFFQFEPYHVSLGTRKALKVSCGSWHVACVVCANQETKPVTEIPEGKPEIPIITTENETEGSLSNNGLILRRGQEIEINKESRTVCKKSSVENFTPDVSFRENVEPVQRRVTDDLLICANQTRNESNQKDVTAGENISKSRNMGQIDSFHSDSDGKGFREQGAEENNVSDERVADNTNFYNHVVSSDLEEKPALTLNSKNEETAEHINKVVYEEKPAFSSKVLASSASGDPAVEDINERFTNNLDIGATRTCDFVSRNDSTSTFSDTIHEVAPLTSSATEPTSVISAEIVESNQPDKDTKENTEYKVDDEFDYGFATFSGQPETVETACEEEKEAVVESKGERHRVTRTRARSEQRSSEDSLVSQEISSTLRSGSLDSLKLYHQQDDVPKDSRPSRVSYSPPANSRNSVGHLNREKRPARMLRYTSFDVEYHLPNQPVHTVDVAITPYLRPHPPVSRTQSSPSLYSSNLIGSPLGSRRKNSPSSKIPRPPTSGVNADESLPPRPPVHGIRRPLGHRPVFSSGTSWRKRK